MRKKERFKVVSLGVLFFIFLVGCSVEEIKELSPIQTRLEKITEKLDTLENFKATANIQYISNKNINTYHVAQTARMDGSYRIEVLGPEPIAGNVTISDGVHIFQMNTVLGLSHLTTADDSPERTSLFLTHFIAHKKTATPEHLTITENETNTTLTLIFNNDTPYLHSQTLTIDNSTLMPTSLITYDVNGTARIVVEYTDIFFNVPIDEAAFLME